MGVERFVRNPRNLIIERAQQMLRILLLAVGLFFNAESQKTYLIETYDDVGAKKDTEFGTNYADEDDKDDEEKSDIVGGDTLLWTMAEAFVPGIKAIEDDFWIMEKAVYPLFKQIPQKMKDITPALRDAAEALWKNGKLTDEELLAYAKAGDLSFAKDGLQLLHDTPFKQIWDKLLGLNIIEEVFDKLPKKLKRYEEPWKGIRDVMKDWIVKLEEMKVVKP